LRSGRRLGPILLAILLVATASVPVARGAPPELAPSLYGRFLTNLSMPTLAPGSSGSVGFSLSDPLTVAISGITLVFEVYAFNAYPGNATGTVPAGGSPEFSGVAGASGGRAVLTLPSLSPGSAPYGSPGQVELTVAAPAGSPEGTYAIRTSLAFSANASSYLLESRGYFSSSQWANATAPTHAPSSLNVSRLGVSGILPESAVLVRSNPYPVALAVVLAGAVVLAALGGYWAVRRRPGSRSGAVAGPPPSHADTALGNSRSNDGD
jgi:hypothetical protein